MGHDEYFCHACKRMFSQAPTPADYEGGDIVCAHCGSEEVERLVSAFYPISPREVA